MRSAPFRAVLVAAAALAIVAACASSSSTPAPSAAASVAAAGAMSVTGAWARETPPGTMTTAAYMTIANGTGTDDALVSASTPVGMAQIHEVMAVGSADPMSSEAPMMGMQQIEKLPIPAGGSVELKPGSFHIMIMDVKEPLKAGSTIEVTLTFEKAPPITVTAQVRGA
jgi:copper(I)-binding protein